MRRRKRLLVDMQVTVRWTSIGRINRRVRHRDIRHNALVDHDGGGRLVPEGEGSAIPVVHDSSVAVIGGVDLVEESLGWEDLVGDVAGDGDGGEIRCESDLSGFRVDDQVDLELSANAT